jgi:ABC-type Fe3+ transport system substrate-binding protein
MTTVGCRLLLLVMGSAACQPAQAPRVGATNPPAEQPAAPVDPKAQDALDKLVLQARAEPAFDVAINSSAVKSAPKIVDAFKKRFGLDKVKVNADVAGGETGQFQKALAEFQAGSRPSLDAMQGGEDNIITLAAADASAVVPDWELLVTAINPLVRSGQATLSDISPPHFAGRGFVWATRSKSLLYNTDLAKEQDLPRIRKDLADPKYMGKLATAPFTTEWQYGLLFYDKDEWLEVADKIGKNAIGVLNFDAQLDRLLLGEFAFSPSNTYYYFQVKAHSKNAPLGVHFFKDYTAMTQLMYTVRKGTKAPASATLFSIWASTPEFEDLAQPENFTPNLRFGQSALDEQERKLIKDSGTKLVTWFDSDETKKVLDWFGTAEGKAYNAKLTRALTQRKS